VENPNAAEPGEVLGIQSGQRAARRLMISAIEWAEGAEETAPERVTRRASEPLVSPA
jgi:hypothetical protein